MLDFKYILLVFGIAVLVVLLTRKAILNSKKGTGKPSESSLDSKQPPPLSPEQFQAVWKSLQYLFILAGLGNLYVAYHALQGALATHSYVLWIDMVLNVLAAATAVAIWRLRKKTWVYTYIAITLVPIFFFLSTGHYRDAMLRLFPLVIIYLAVKPIWENL